VGFGTPVPLLVGIVLILIGIGLLFLDTFKPGYKRDSDTVYAILFMLAGLFALLSWQADFQMAMQFMISAGSLVALMVERIRSRSANNEPMPPMSGRASRRESREDRPSRSYRAGFDESPRSEVRAEFDDDPISMEEPSRARRIRGGRDGGSARDNYQGQDAYFDQLSEDTREPRRSEGSRRSSNSYADDNQYGEGQRSRRRGALQLEGDVTPNLSDSYGEARPEASVEPASGRRRGRSNASPSAEPEVATGTRGSRRRSRSNGDSATSRVSPLDGDYVDYKPLGMPKSPNTDDDFDNSSNFDDNPSFR
jgi:Ycf66 protein N-terminus